MNRLISKPPRVSRVPVLGNLRKFWIIVFVTVILLWPFSGLTAWHLIFFGALSIGIYLSYSRYILPLIVYFSIMLLYWVVVPFIQGGTGVRYYTWSGEVPDFGPGALAFIAAHLLGIFIGFQSKKFAVSNKEISNIKFSFVGVAFIFALLLCLIVIVDLKTVLLPRNEQLTGEAQNYTIFLRNIAKLLPPLLVTYFVLEADNGLKKNTKFATFIVLAMCLLLVSNPVNTSRFLSLFGLVIVILAYTIKFARLNFLAWALALTPIYSIFLLGITSAMRSGLDNFNYAFAFQSLRSLEFSSYSIFVDALNLHEFPNGNYVLSHLFVLVPRSIWPEKADSIGIYVAENAGYVYHNVGLNSFFNGYVDYGYFGIFIVSLAFGALVKNLNPVFESPSFRNRRFMYGVIFTGMAPMFFRGDLSTAMLAAYAAAFAYEAIRFLTRFRLGPRTK